jgi:hypothetical protein
MGDRKRALREKVRALARRYTSGSPTAPEPEEDEVPAALVVFALIKEKHPEKADVQDEMACPLCGKGIIKYSIAGSNGHVWARCTTENCVAFMQ